MKNYLLFRGNAKQLKPRISRWLIVGLLWTLIAFAPAIMPSSGLTPGTQPVKKFLNGTLPASTPDQVIGYEVVEAFPNLTADSTLVFVPEPGTDRIIIGSRQGVYEAFENRSNITSAEKQPFLDINARTAGVWDGGNLGLTFHPDFLTDPSKRFIYIWYCARVEGGTTKAVWNSGENATLADDVFLRLSRFTVVDDVAGDYADPSSEFIMINVHLYNSSHRGGGMAWDADGNLLVTIGEQFRAASAQNITNTLQGGWIRLDVDQRGGGISHIPLRVVQNDPTYNAGTTINGFTGHYAGNEPASQADMASAAFLANPDKEFTGRGYYIPNDNPDWGTIAGLSAGAYFEEYCTIGNRNPHRMTQDPVNGRFWSGEVGAGSREEINVLETDQLSTGINFGWPGAEGNQGSPSSIGSDTYNPPVTDFTRSEANAIIGGYVYRGTALPSLVGKYICGGYSQQRIFAVSYDEVGGHVSNISREVIATFDPGSLITFGQDHDGEIYLCRQGNDTKIYKLQEIGMAVPAPALLSDVAVFNTDADGDFSEITELSTQTGLIPYALNVPFWSDGALKYRFLAVPNDEEDDGNGLHNMASEKMIFSEDGEWQFPIGTVLVKHFELPLDETDPSVTVRLETRFVVHGEDGKYYYITYKWRDDQTDADLIDMGEDKTFTITTSSGTRDQIWHFPDRTECLQCHNSTAGSVLGAKTRQLNRDIDYGPIGGTVGNQLETFLSLGMFAGTPFAIGDIPGFLTLSPSDGSDPLDARARSYLDANCSYCHRPGSANRAVFDARITTPLEFQNLIYGPLNDDLEDASNRVIVPQDVGHSVAHTRMNSTEAPIAMPPLAKNEVDVAGTALIASWIGTLDINFEPPCAGLQGEYFNNIDLSGSPVFSRIDPTVNYNFGAGSPDASVNANNFSARFSGELLPPEDGTYTIYATADDGVRLWVDGQLLVDEWQPQGATTFSGNVMLMAGTRVPIVLEYYEATGNAVIQLEWSYNAVGQEVIPQTSLCLGEGVMLSQTIDFPAIPDKCLGDPDFDLNATASSGLPVTYTITTGDQYINLTGGMVTIDAANITSQSLPLPATVTIEAMQGGDDTYSPAAGMAQSFQIADGSGSFSLITNGAASRELCGNCYIIIPDIDNAAGTAWSETKLNLNESFRLTLTVNLGGTDAGGGDGMTFALNDDPLGTAFLGSNGTPMAVNGMAPSFGVEFDTYQSTGAFDPAFDHLSFWSGGDVTMPLQTPVQANALSANIEDNTDHDVVIEWNPVDNLFSIEFDGSLRDVYSGDIRSSFGATPEAYFGFGAGSGSATNEHKVCIVDLETNIPIFNVSLTKTDENCGQADGTVTASVSGGVGPYSYNWSAGTVSPGGTSISDLTASVYLVTITDSDNPQNSKVASITVNNIPGPTLALTSSADADCSVANGQATVTATANGGSTVFDYFWSDAPTVAATGTRTDLSTGTYSVTVEDENGCQDILTDIEIGEIPPFTLTLTPTAATFCGAADGSASVVADPAGAYDILWDDPLGQTTATASNLTAGTYNVTVTDPSSGCFAVGTVFVGQIGCPAFDIVGDATAPGGDCYVLTTPTPNNQAGAAWSQTQVDLTNGFIIEAEVIFGDDDTGTNMGGADGIAFALHDDPRGTTAIGGYGGSYGISLPNGTQAVTPSFGVEFDTYPNAGEPTADHLSFFGNGDVYTPLPPGAAEVNFASNIEDDNMPHTVRIEWDADLQKMSVFFDEVLIADYSGDLVVDFFEGNSSVYWGFAGGTGGATNQQEFCLTHFEVVTPVFDITMTTEDEKCDMANGTATATVNGGGVPTYSYSWNDTQTGITANGLVAGSYSVTISDSDVPANTAVRFVTIDNIAGPTLAEISVTDASCSATDGSATVGATGGTPPYDYQWDVAAGSQTDATATGLAPGTYEVMVTDDNDCTDLITVTVDEEPPFTLEFNGTDASCGNADGSATVSAVSAVGQLTILWDAAAGSQETATAVNLAFGTYSVSVTDETNCTAVGTVDVLESGCIGLVSNSLPDPRQIYAGGDCYTLTEAAGYQAGTIWSPSTIDLTQNFLLTTQISFGSSEPGADGVAFALQTDTRGTGAIGDIGGSFGIDDQNGGTSVSPSFGAVFKTYPSSADDRVYIFRDGNTNPGAAIVAPNCATGPSCANIEDGTPHTVIFDWNAGLQLFSVFFDDVLVAQYDAAAGDDLATILGSNQVYWGFGAGTGGAVNEHEVCITSMEIGVSSYQVIDFPDLFDLCADEGPVQLNATASSGLPVSYEIIEGEEFVAFDETDPTLLLILKGSGQVTIEATQGGNADYLPAVPVPQSFQVDEPSGIAFNTYGNALEDPAPDDCDCFIITPDADNQAGTVWSQRTLDMDHAFTFEFDIYMTEDLSADNRDHADGITFALQNVDPTYVGSNGTEMAVDGLTHSFGLEFDNYASATAVLPTNTPYDPGTPALFELEEDHVSFWAGGDVTVPLAGPVVVDETTPNFEDGAYHRVIVDWDPLTQTMTAIFDGNQVLTYTAIGNGMSQNLVTDFLNGNPKVHFGFGGGTGGKTSLQKVCVIELCRDITFDLNVMLQGPYNYTTEEMHDLLRNTLVGGQSAIPLTDPYGLGESVTSLPADVVDWVLVEVRHGNNYNCVMDSRACFVTKDGTIIDTDGSPGVTFQDLCLTEGYVTIKHRNHLGVMTENSVPFLFSAIAP